LEEGEEKEEILGVTSGGGKQEMKKQTILHLHGDICENSFKAWCGNVLRTDKG
jgi:hypothetical protein